MMIIIVVPTVKWVIKTLRFVRFIRPKDFTAWIYFVITNCVTFGQNVKPRCQFLGNNATDFDVIASRQIISALGITFANFLRHRRLLVQLQTKSQVTCRCCQIDAIADETYQPSMDYEVVPKPVGDALFTGIRKADVPQGVKGGNWYHCCCD